MAKAPLEEPDGVVLQPDVIAPGEESELLERFEELRWDPIVIRGQAARRTARHFGLGYDYESRTPRPGEPIPDWIEPARRAAARLAASENVGAWEVDLVPRSGYVLTGEARWSWEHSIPPTKELRYSVTFRTLR